MEITKKEFDTFKELYKYSNIAVNQIICMATDEDDSIENCQPCQNREDLAKTLNDVKRILEKYNNLFY